MKNIDHINLNFFSEETVEKIFSSHSEDQKKLKEQLYQLYKKQDTQLKEEIKKELSELKISHAQALVEIEKGKKESLSKAESQYKSEHSSPTKEDTKAYGDIKVGIETSAKRSKIKENNQYAEQIKNCKLRRFDLHEEYVALLKIAEITPSRFEKLKSSQLENRANFNIRRTLTNKKTWINLVPLFMLIIIIIAYAIAKKANQYTGDLGDIINNGIFVAVVATGAVFIYSQGGFDMSLGSASLTCATVAAITWQHTHMIWLTLLIAVLLGAALGTINAILATILNLPVMVMTLTMMNILAAINEELLGNPMYPDDGLPTSPWVYASILLIFFILCWFIFNYSKVGRRNKFIGSNKTAAKFNGISLMKAGIISFAISGIGLGLCGFIFTSSKSDGGQFTSNTVLGQVGLNVVIAIVFGGMTTSGGPKSKISCAVIGAFFSVFLDELFAAMSTPAFAVGDFSYMVKGIIFIIVSLANMWDTRSKMLASGGSIQ